MANTNVAPITVQVGGLGAGEQVIVQSYMDLNGNGVVDANEPMYDSFTISDGQVNTIGGVTNISMQNDTDPASGSIMTAVSFGQPLGKIVGPKIIRLVSPTHNFPTTNVSFSVTNAALAQGVAGTIFANGAPVPGAIAIALTLPDNNFAGGAISDGAGRYYLALPPGTYGVFPTLPNYFTDQSLAAVAVLTNGLIATNNLYLTNGTATVISGSIYDAASSNGVAGVFIQLNAGNLFEIAFTDANGNYAAAVTADKWKLKLDGAVPAQSGFVVSQGGVSVDASGGSVSNANFALPKATALFYGRVSDGTGAGLPGLQMFGNDNSNQYKAEGFTDLNGNYAVGVITNNNPWMCMLASENPSLANSVVSGANAVSIASNQAVQENFTVLPVTAHISGRLTDNSGNPLGGIQMNANAFIGGTNYNSSQLVTDSGGNYSVGVVNGMWNVFANCCGNNGLDNRGLYDPNFHVVNVPPTNAVLNITAYPFGTPFLNQPTRLGPSTFQFNLNGSVGTNYIVQASTNLSSTNWFTILVTNPPSNSLLIQDNNATNRQRFYRALIGP